MEFQESACEICHLILSMTGGNSFLHMIPWNAATTSSGAPPSPWSSMSRPSAPYIATLIFGPSLSPCFLDQLSVVCHDVIRTRSKFINWRLLCGFVMHSFACWDKASAFVPPSALSLALMVCMKLTCAREIICGVHGSRRGFAGRLCREGE